MNLRKYHHSLLFFLSEACSKVVKSVYRFLLNLSYPITTSFNLVSGLYGSIKATLSNKQVILFKLVSLIILWLDKEKNEDFTTVTRSGHRDLLVVNMLNYVVSSSNQNQEENITIIHNWIPEKDISL